MEKPLHQTPTTPQVLLLTSKCQHVLISIRRAAHPLLSYGFHHFSIVLNLDLKLRTLYRSILPLQHDTSITGTPARSAPRQEEHLMLQDVVHSVELPEPTHPFRTARPPNKHHHVVEHNNPPTTGTQLVLNTEQVSIGHHLLRPDRRLLPTSRPTSLHVLPTQVIRSIRFRRRYLLPSRCPPRCLHRGADLHGRSVGTCS